MATSQWTAAFLDDMRRMGDPPADDVIDRLFADRDVKEVSAVLATLVRNDQIVPEAMPEVARAYFEAAGDLPAIDPERMDRISKLFEDLGPEIMMVFACASLPFCYVDHRGMPVLASTGRLTDDVTRRVAETAQMLVDVLSKNGLLAQGRGVRTVQKVRLMHACIRHLVRRRHGDAWIAEYGLPINQEDLAYTLMTFTWVVIAGLRTFGARMTPQQEDDWCATWGFVGRLLGIREELVPTNAEDSRVLFELLLQRLCGRSADGANMTAALLGLIRDSVPGPIFRDLGATMMRELSGERICDLLDVPKPNFTRIFYRLLQGITWTTQKLGGSWDPAAGALRSFNVLLLEGFIRKGMGGGAITFTPEQELESIQQGRRGIPLELHQHWTRSAPARHGVQVKPAPISPAAFA